MSTYCPRCDRRLDVAGLATCPECGTRVVTVDDGTLVGRVLEGRYEVQRILGQGGMGTVYEAKQRIVDRKVALKVLRAELAHDETLAKRFTREARAVAALASPHTVTLHDFGVTRDGLLYFTMEMLEGRSLARAIEDEGALDWRRAVRILLQACESIREAHARGILHRDLKPDNLFLSRSADGSEFVKVLDFGLAKMITGDEALTQAGVAYGTPQYLSPEQARGQPLDARSDLYSLGVVLYEMLCGETPFLAASPMGFLVQHVTELPRPVRERRPDLDLPAALDDLLMRTLAKDPADRPADVDAFADALRQTLGDPTPGPLPSPRSTAGRGGRLGVIAAVVTVVVAGSVAGAWLAVRSSTGGTTAVADAPPSAFLRALAAPAVSALHKEIGAARLLGGDLDGAAAGFRLALEADPANLAARFNLGLARMKARAPDDAVAAFTAVLERDPAFPDAFAARGRAHLLAGRFVDARADLERAVAARPDDATLHLLIGQIAARQGDTPRATQAFCRAQALGIPEAAEGCR